MILFAMALAAQAASSPIPADDIVVTAQRMKRLKRLRMTTKLNHATGVTRCVFKRRSGDPAVDGAVCNAVLACAQDVKTMEEMRGCVAPTLDALIAKNVAWRANASEHSR